MQYWLNSISWSLMGIGICFRIPAGSPERCAVTTVKPTVQYVKRSPTASLWIIRVAVTLWGPCQSSHQTRGVTLCPVLLFQQRAVIPSHHLVSAVTHITLHLNRFSAPGARTLLIKTSHLSMWSAVISQDWSCSKAVWLRVERKCEVLFIIIISITTTKSILIYMALYI